MKDNIFRTQDNVRERVLENELAVANERQEATDYLLVTTQDLLQAANETITKLLQDLTIADATVLFQKDRIAELEAEVAELKTVLEQHNIHILGKNCWCKPEVDNGKG